MGKRHDFHLGQRGGGKARIGQASILIVPNRMTIPNKSEFKTEPNYSIPKRTSPTVELFHPNPSQSNLTWFRNE
jgi:hypothetical protein